MLQAFVCHKSYVIQVLLYDFLVRCFPCGSFDHNVIGSYGHMGVLVPFLLSVCVLISFGFRVGLVSLVWLAWFGLVCLVCFGSVW